MDLSPVNNTPSTAETMFLISLPSRWPSSSLILVCDHGHDTNASSEVFMRGGRTAYYVSLSFVSPVKTWTARNFSMFPGALEKAMRTIRAPPASNSWRLSPCFCRRIFNWTYYTGSKCAYPYRISYLSRNYFTSSASFSCKQLVSSLISSHKPFTYSSATTNLSVSIYSSFNVWYVVRLFITAFAMNYLSSSQIRLSPTGTFKNFLIHSRA